VQNSQFSAADKFFVNFVLARMQVPHLPRALFARLTRWAFGRASCATKARSYELQARMGRTRKWDIYARGLDVVPDRAYECE
jgi:hypothetical protein